MVVFMKINLYISFTDESSVRAVTIWVVCDLETDSGRELVYEVVKQMVYYIHRFQFNFKPDASHIVNGYLVKLSDLCNRSNEISFSGFVNVGEMY